jgi:uncharacterized protein YecE (DUF72 family)
MQKVIHVGTAGWAIPRAISDRFPSAGSALQRYAARFSAAEINSTFRRSHQPQTFVRWANAVREEFRFAVKMPKAITHELKLVGTADLLGTFLQETGDLGTKRGPLLLQLPPSLAYDCRVAQPFFELLRAHTSHAVVCEPRHPSWFASEAEELLASYAIARAAADPARIPDAGSPGGIRTLEYYRLHGTPRMYYSAYDPSFLSRLENAIIQSAAKEVWCIFDNTASGAATANALEIQTRLTSPQ